MEKREMGRLTGSERRRRRRRTTSRGDCSISSPATTRPPPPPNDCSILQWWAKVPEFRDPTWEGSLSFFSETTNPACPSFRDSHSATCTGNEESFRPLQADLLNGQINRRRRRSRGRGAKLNYQPDREKPADPDQIASKAAVAARAGRVCLATLMAPSSPLAGHTDGPSS